MTPCHICGFESLPNQDVCPEHLSTRAAEAAIATGREAMFAYVRALVQLPDDISAAVDAIIDIEELDYPCRILMAAEDVENGETLRDAAEKHGIGFSFFRSSWRRYRVSRIASCCLHPRRCQHCGGSSAALSGERRAERIDAGCPST